MNEGLLELRNCDVCKHERCDEVELDYLGENITGEEACSRLQVPYSRFKTHIEKHLKKDISALVSANAPALAKRIFEKGDQLLESCDRSLEMIKEVRAQWNQSKKPEWITAAVKLEQQVANNIEKLGKMQGEFKESGAVRIEQMNIQVNNMTQELIEGMCPACKAKLAPKLLNTLNLTPNHASTQQTKT